METYERLPRLALLPIFTGVKTPNDWQETCPVCLQELVGAEIGETEMERFYQLLYFHLENSFRYQMVPRRLTFEHILAPEQISNLDLRQVREIHWEEICAQARQQGVIFLMTASLFRYEEREGDAFGVIKPAAVAFDLHLTESEHCRIIWRKHYEETQKSLTEDVTKVKKVFERKARWLTADELAREAITSLLPQMPNGERTEEQG